jgi:hypothetical protein
LPVLPRRVLDIPLPRMIKVLQKFESRGLADLERSIREQCLRREIRDRIRPGQRLALAVGSRGITNLARIVGTVADCLKTLGAEPFIVPAMGSHGGGTAEGQREVLHSLGISEHDIGVPIVSSMEVVRIGETSDGIPVLMNREAFLADMVVPIARIKPHTDFRGAYESGICKMLAIGLGSHEGCSRLHQEGFTHFHQLIPEVAGVFLKQAHIGFALALVEDAYEETAIVETVTAEDILEREPRLLKKAKAWMPRIMIPEIDILAVEEIGKEISGAGMDPNIIGRTTQGILSDFSGPNIKRIVVLDLSEETHGNACGIGLADFTTKKVWGKIDLTATYANVIASGNPEAGRIPVLMEGEKDAIQAALSCSPGVNIDQPRIVRIKNTLDLRVIHVSENMLPELEKNPALIMEP